MNNLKQLTFLLVMALSLPCGANETEDISVYNVAWHTPSANSSESMPCGGGDIGLNVWVENGEILFYISRSGTFDENNEFLKLGRVRLSLSPEITAGNDFCQTLQLDRGAVLISGNNTETLIWVDVFRPVVHIEITGKKPVALKAAYENWRFEDFHPVEPQLRSTSFKHTRDDLDIITRKDVVETFDNRIIFYHRNRSDIDDIFDLTVREQKMESVKNEMFNPIKNLTFGGYLKGENIIFQGISEGQYLDTKYKSYNFAGSKAAVKHSIEIGIAVEQTPTLEDWKTLLNSIEKDALKNRQTAKINTQDWWKQFWNRSYIFIDGDSTDEHWQVARNYNLFRYQLGCNAFGKYPTKFNGGLFTFDPSLIKEKNRGTPDHRDWGGGTMTAQNQRLVYWGMLRSGDFEMMKSQFDFYLRSLKNAELRSMIYWNHGGACFTEQIENFGLPQFYEYSLWSMFKRPDNFDAGIQYNPWINYLWDTVFEFCMMIIETERYNNQDITEYIPLIESCLAFFDEHYRYEAAKRGPNIFDSRRRYIFYPSTACETYKMAYNPTTVICALRSVITRILELPEKYVTTANRNRWTAMLRQIPPVPMREVDGHKMLAPAENWQLINNIEAPQLYPVFPWSFYGLGKPDIEIARNTYFFDPHVVQQKSVESWKQYPIFAARLGLTEEADSLIRLKLKDSERRFPTFWGPGHDWVPDHNWGGSGMIALQEMLMQTDGKKIYLLPAWNCAWNVRFKLHAPYQTTVEAELKDGKIVNLKVSPAERLKDVEIIPTVFLHNN
jgi:hypothetical protein